MQQPAVDHEEARKHSKSAAGINACYPSNVDAPVQNQVFRDQAEARVPPQVSHAGDGVTQRQIQSQSSQVQIRCNFVSAAIPDV
jgi:hypothetical protein